MTLPLRGRACSVLGGEAGQAEEGHLIVVLRQLVIEVAVFLLFLPGKHVGIVAQLADVKGLPVLLPPGERRRGFP